ncbi:thioredoxin family protein [Candidatus Peregrinibacteria bacterium]|nr:thioredoxin family protein [Candidatus Peregrinibacteria bacterium]
MTLLESINIPLNTPVIDFKLPATSGGTYSPSDFDDKKILVIIFMCNHCPYVHAIINRLISIQSDYLEKGVQLIGINANDAENYPDDSFESMKDFVVDRGINFVYLRDEDQTTAKAYKAQCTPDIYVFDSKRQLVYHGRIDDNWKNEFAVSKNELRDALDSILSNQKVPENQLPTIGCSIKWKKEHL